MSIGWLEYLYLRGIIIEDCKKYNTISQTVLCNITAHSDQHGLGTDSVVGKIIMMKKFPWNKSEPNK